MKNFILSGKRKKSLDNLRSCQTPNTSNNIDQVIKTNPDVKSYYTISRISYIKPILTLLTFRQLMTLLNKLNACNEPNIEQILELGEYNGIR
jgi:hypothetical protein